MFYWHIVRSCYRDFNYLVQVIILYETLDSWEPSGENTPKIYQKSKSVSQVQHPDNILKFLHLLFRIIVKMMKEREKYLVKDF